MGEELHRREAILEAATFAAERFARAATWREALPEVLARFGAAAEVSRVWLSHNFVGSDGELYSHQDDEWDADGVTREQDDPQLAAYPYESGGFGRWRDALSTGQVISGHVRDFPPAEQALFIPQGTVSIVGVPVFVGEAWWGIVGFDECRRERTWSEAEVRALRAAANTVGAAVRLERVEQERQERQRQYLAVFDASTDGLAVTDLDGVLVEANPAFHTMHGYEPGELAGQHASTWTAPGWLSTVEAYLGGVESGVRGTLEARHVRRDGVVFPVEVRGTVFDFRGRPHLLSVVRDVTERVLATELLERRVSALGETAANLVVDQPLEVTLRNAVRTVVRASGGVAAALHVIDRVTGRLLLLATDGLPDGYEEALRGAWEMGVDSPAVAALHEQRVTLVRDAPARTLANPRAAPLHPYLPHVEWNSLLSVPLDTQGRSFGALHVYYRPGAEPASEEVGFLSAVADQMAVAVENASLLAAGRQTAALLERQRLARDLHDSVSQALFSMTLHARAAQLAMRRQGLDDDGPLGRTVAQLRELTQGALAEMRALIFELRPGALEEEGLMSALRKQATALASREGLPIDVTGPEERLALSPDVAEHLYRVVLEALHNTVKHADATRAQVLVEQHDTSVTVSVTDDGHGFDPDATPVGHLGLTTMRDRAAAVGGALTVDTRPGGGTTITLTIPLAADDHEGAVG